MTPKARPDGRIPTIVLEVSPLAQGAFGISTYIRGLLGGLQVLLERGEIAARFKLLYLNPDQTPPPPPGPAFENVVLRLPRRLAQAFWAKVPAIPLDWFVRGDLFHGCAHVVPFTRMPAWVTMHDVSWRAFPESFGASQRSFNENFCGPSLAHCLASGGGIVSVSHFTAREVEHHYGIARNRQVVVHEAAGSAPAPADAAARAALRSWLGPGAQRPFALCLGLVESRKNIDGAIAIWEAARRRGTDCVLAIVGKDGEGADGIRRRAAESPWSADILMPGRAPAELLEALYAEAAATLFLSHYEGFGLPVLESMAAGTPVIVSDRASLPEVWGNPPEGTARLVVDPDAPEQGAELLGSLLADPGFRARCVAHGRVRANQFSWESTARETWNAWASSLDGSRHDLHGSTATKESEP